MQRRANFVLFLTVLVASLFIISCGDDNDPVAVPAACVEADHQGTITIETEPDVINAGWQLSGPDGYLVAGTGDLVLTDLFAGNYALQWNEVDQYTRPNPSTFTQFLSTDQELTFVGEYVYSGPSRWEPVLIPPTSVTMPTTFTMGSLIETDETPHEVTLTKKFNMAATEVTNRQYVMALQWAYDQGIVSVDGQDVLDGLDGSTDRVFRWSPAPGFITFSDGVFSTDSPDTPAQMVSWFGAASYCDWLSLQNDLPRAYDHSTWICNSNNPYEAVGFRLPTEAEWEFACRAGTTTVFNTGDCLNSYYEGNFGTITYAGCPTFPRHGDAIDVGILLPNDWGLYDMHGNVGEWSNDWYEAYSGDVTDPVGAESGEDRVLRGGGHSDTATDCRSAYRDIDSWNHLDVDIGLRPVKSVQ